MSDADRYKQFEERELILRDQLAIDRTKLANDRTFLSFVRTGLTLFIAGVTALHFIESTDLALSSLAWLFTIGGPIVIGFGLNRYKKMKNDISLGEAHLSEKKSMFSFKMPSLHLPHFPGLDGGRDDSE